ncbi:hypothetical protein E3U55_15575 [Filobacillus milosensis]|uniref:DUF5317 domain-containing protein n=1 Tax=Filobacillus milosensis TaxID=94137 RepID=A0A4Y8IEW0_9BACI|nr:DUF5317 family protein [Filobacillus milosensis]TFB13676.1 hypothetical protein E3U55_15575 [Filobacillus milosensis]
MIYAILAALILTLLLKRNPSKIQHNITLRWSGLIVLCFVIQIILTLIALYQEQKYEIIFIMTFLGLLIGLIANHSLVGVKWIIVGASLNVLALIVFGGLMPVSEAAMNMVGQDPTNFSSDSRHQLLQEGEFWWVLADWVPLKPYVMSVGDIFVGIGFIRFLTVNSPLIKRSGDNS